MGCIDANLPGGRLGPGAVVVLRGEAGTAKSALLRCIIVSYIAAPEIGGHGLPVVCVDADTSFDPVLIARLLESKAGLALGAAATPSLTREALSRLMVFRPWEPAEMLKQLCALQTLMAANPTVSLVAVDSLTAWRPLAKTCPRSVGPVLRECWRVLERLQRDHCVAVVATHRESPVEGPCAWGGSTGSSCHLAVTHCAGSSSPQHPGMSFAVAAKGEPGKAVSFGLSPAGEVVCAA